MTPRRILLTMIATLAVMVATTSCSDDDEQQEADPQQIVDQAAATFAETNTVQFSLAIDGSIPVDQAGMISLSGVEGEVERPSRAHAEASVQFAGSSVTMELIAADGQMYLRNIVSGEWEQAPTDLQYDPSRVFDEQAGIEAILGELEEVEVEGTESVNDSEAWHLTGTIPTDAVTRLTGDVFQGETLDVDAWVATDDHRILRVELSDPSSTETPTWDIRLTGHNEPVDIPVPEIG